MSVPTSSNFPNEFDDTVNLFEAHDSLRVRLALDYTPGDTTIAVDGDISKFPSTGLITLTDQCSDSKLRAISFFYESRTENQFRNLSILPGFIDNYKHAIITNVTQNVMAEYHENLKNSIISIQRYLGLKGEIDNKPFSDTLIGRINFLKKMVFTPRAWFKVENSLGLIDPEGFEVTVKDEVFRKGDKDITYEWDFGNGETLTQVNPSEKTFKIKYYDPGSYDISLTVSNEYGSDTVVLRDSVKVKTEAPKQTEIKFELTSKQTIRQNSSNPYDIVVRSPVNEYINVYIEEGESNFKPGYTYGGEKIEDGIIEDPIISHTWEFSDDLEHKNNRIALASYSIGGVYDIKIRVDTKFGSYRITTYENSLDIVEQNNLWLLLEDSYEIKSHEFGLISETWKTLTNPQTIYKNDSFLDGVKNEDQAKREFHRNTGFTKRGNIESGSNGTSIIFWASGSDSVSPISTQKVDWLEYNGFNDSYSTSNINFHRPWNWMFLGSNSTAYFAFGSEDSISPIPYTNSSNEILSKFQISPTIQYSPGNDNVYLNNDNFDNGAQELLEHITINYTDSGEPENGRFSVYRSSWKDSVGYFLRNSNVEDLFRIQSFYRTVGDLTEPVQVFKKLPDMQGQVKEEGQLISVLNGLLFFNNSGNIPSFNEITSVWEVTSPILGGGSFSRVQDVSKPDFNNLNNTLLAASDGDRKVYLSFDYSDEAFYRFDAIDKTYSILGGRPPGNQWVLGVF